MKGELAGLVSEVLTGRRWPTYGEARDQGIDIEEFQRSVQAAHECWVAARNT